MASIRTTTAPSKIAAGVAFASAKELIAGVACGWVADEEVDEEAGEGLAVVAAMAPGVAVVVMVAAGDAVSVGVGMPAVIALTLVFTHVWSMHLTEL